jgi:hypothetical protein
MRRSTLRRRAASVEMVAVDEAAWQREIAAAKAREEERVKMTAPLSLNDRIRRITTELAEVNRLRRPR